MRARLTRLVLPGLVYVGLVLSCSAGGGGSPVGHSAGSQANQAGSGTAGSLMLPVGGGGPGPIIDCDPTAPGSPCNPDTPAPAHCGDGVLDDDEVCDDANRNNDDGCQGNCLLAAPGFSCNPPGQLCHELVVCGDSIVGSSEQCDDGNA